MRWVADIGNRFTKIGVVVGDAIEERYVVRSDAFGHADHEGADEGADEGDGGGPATIDAAIPDGDSQLPGSVVFASVNPSADVPFARWVERRFGLDAVQLGRDRPVPIENDCHGVGVDRLVNAVAAIDRFPTGAIAIDVGTAITVDAVSPGRRFLGGAILEGPHLAARALNDYTAQLPLVEPHEPQRAIATSTREALESGVFYGTLGGVVALVDAFRRELGFDADVALTGGDAPLFGPALEARLEGVHHVPELTLDGVRLSAEA